MIVSASIRFARYKGEDLDVFCLISCDAVKGEGDRVGLADVASIGHMIVRTPHVSR